MSGGQKNVPKSKGISRSNMQVQSLRAVLEKKCPHCKVVMDIGDILAVGDSADTRWDKVSSRHFKAYSHKDTIYPFGEGSACMTFLCPKCGYIALYRVAEVNRLVADLEKGSKKRAIV